MVGCLASKFKRLTFRNPQSISKRYSVFDKFCLIVYAISTRAIPFVAAHQQVLPRLLTSKSAISALLSTKFLTRHINVMWPLLSPLKFGVRVSQVTLVWQAHPRKRKVNSGPLAWYTGNEFFAEYQLSVLDIARFYLLHWDASFLKLFKNYEARMECSDVNLYR
jgi:hypothetical protein